MTKHTTHECVKLKTLIGAFFVYILLFPISISFPFHFHFPLFHVLSEIDSETISIKLVVPGYVVYGERAFWGISLGFPLPTSAKHLMFSFTDFRFECAWPGILA